MTRSFMRLAMLACMVTATSALAQTPASGSASSASAAAQAGSPEASAPKASTIAEKERQAGEIMRQMLTPENVASMESTAPAAHFGGEFARLAYENVYVPLWTRPGLSPRDRSLLTIGILIGNGAEDELRGHFASGLRNGLTREQLEEAIYHATAYAGFPRASRALALAAEALAQDAP